MKTMIGLFHPVSPRILGFGMLVLLTSIARGETVCDGATLGESALGICRAYCEAQHCDLNNTRACESLRLRFQETTGSRVLPCDPVCGDGRLHQAFEECDPPGGGCNQGFTCDSCACVAVRVPGCTGNGCTNGVTITDEGSIRGSR